MENIMTTAINILATFRLVFNWLSRLRLAEFIVVTPLLESSLFRLTNLMVVLHVLQKKEKMDMISFFFSFLMFLEKGTIIYVPIMVDGRIKNHMVAFYFSLFSAEKAHKNKWCLIYHKKAL